MSNDELQKAIDEITNEGMTGAAPQEDTGAVVELPEEMMSGNNSEPVASTMSIPTEELQAANKGMNIEVQQIESATPNAPDLSNNPFVGNVAPMNNTEVSTDDAEGLPTLEVMPEAPAPTPEITTNGGVEVPVNVPAEMSEAAPTEMILPEAPAVSMGEMETAPSMPELAEAPNGDVNGPVSAPEAPEAAEGLEMATTAASENEAHVEAPESLSGIGETGEVDVEKIKTEAMDELYPLLDVMNGYPEKKFEVALSIARKGDKKAFQTALDAAKAISDSTVRGESLMKLIEAIEEI